MLYVLALVLDGYMLLIEVHSWICVVLIRRGGGQQHHNIASPPASPAGGGGLEGFTWPPPHQRLPQRHLLLFPLKNLTLPPTCLANGPPVHANLLLHKRGANVAHNHRPCGRTSGTDPWLKPKKEVPTGSQPSGPPPH